MKLTHLRNVVTSKIGRQILVAQKNSPAILFGVGIVGIVGTVVLASRATLKLDEILDEASSKLDTARIIEHEDYSDTDRKKDIALIYTQTAGKITRLYAPALFLGVVSVAALTGAHVVLNRRYIGVTAAYATIERAYAEYRKRVIAELGPDKDREFRYALVDKEIVEETPDGAALRTVKALNSKNSYGYTKFFDEGNRNWSKEPWHNQMFIQCQERYANDLLRARGHLFLNEVLDMLGFERTQAGAVVGWLADADARGSGDGYVDFGVFSGDTYMGQEFVTANERSILLDFNVDGVIYNKI